MHDLIQILRAMAAKRAEMPDPLELFLDMGERVVKAVSAEFTVRPEEVAILWRTSDGKHLRFAAPRPFAPLGTIPLSKRDSIAVNTLNKRAGEAINNVPMVRHVAFFETVKLKDRPAPIQKMLSVPIMLGSEAAGVAQVSRKGDSPRAAGPDFTEADVARLQAIVDAVAPLLSQGRPDRF
jgi:hypothetical protein